MVDGFSRRRNAYMQKVRSSRHFPAHVVQCNYGPRPQAAHKNISSRSVGHQRPRGVELSKTLDAPRTRARYSPDVVEAVKTRYPHCRGAADKELLARSLGIASTPQLYNLACRHRVTAGEDRPEREASRQAAIDPKRRELRENPDTIVWTRDDDDYLTRSFGRVEIEVLAHFTGHTETAIAHRARHLGLRKAARHWDVERVSDWLGMTAPEIAAMGVDLHRCCDQRGRMRIVLVETAQLGRALARGGRWQRLVARGADRFFIREVIEATLAERNGEDPWDPMWVSHGHTCINPFSGLSFGLFYAGDDPKLTGANFTVEELSPANIHLLRG